LQRSDWHSSIGGRRIPILTLLSPSEVLVSDNLNNFLVDLASDPVRLDAFLADPLRTLNESLLTEDEKAAVMTRDGARIRTALHITPWQAALPEGVMAKRPPAKGKPKPKSKGGGKSKRKN